MLRKKLIKQEGLSFIETIVVITIIGLMAGLAFPHYLGWVERSRQSEARIQLEAIRGAVLRYCAENSSDYGNCTLNYSAGWSHLDIEQPGSSGNPVRFFAYSLGDSGNTTQADLAYATRNSDGGSYAGAVMGVSRNGAIECSLANYCR